MSSEKTEKKKKKPEIKRDYLTYGLAVYLAVLFIAGIFGDRGLINNFKLHDQSKIIKENVADLEKENRDLRREIDNLQGNMRHIEKIAREDLNMSRE